MTCDHNSYQCAPALSIADRNGRPIISPPQWCTVCGACTLRLPQICDEDAAVQSARQALVKAPPDWRPGIG